MQRDYAKCMHACTHLHTHTPHAHTHTHTQTGTHAGTHNTPTRTNMHTHTCTRVILHTLKTAIKHGNCWWHKWKFQPTSYWEWDSQSSTSFHSTAVKVGVQRMCGVASYDSCKFRSDPLSLCGSFRMELLGPSCPQGRCGGEASTRNPSLSRWKRTQMRRLSFRPPPPSTTAPSNPGAWGAGQQQGRSRWALWARCIVGRRTWRTASSPGRSCPPTCGSSPPSPPPRCTASTTCCVSSVSPPPPSLWVAGEFLHPELISRTESKSPSLLLSQNNAILVFIRTKHNMWVFRVIPFYQPKKVTQNNLNGERWLKNEMES